MAVGGRGKRLSGRGSEDGGEPRKRVKVCEARGDAETGVEVSELSLLLLDPPVESRLWPLVGPSSVLARAASR